MAEKRHTPVKFSRREMADDLPPELNFAKLKLVGRGPKAIEAAARRTIVPLDPDVSAVFTSAREVNAALRGLINLARQSRPKRRRAASAR
jgi:hypothetical protein